MNDRNPEQGYVPLNLRPADQRPRERLWRYGADRLSNAELLAILINSGTRGRSAVQLAEDLLSSCPDGLSDLVRRTPAEIRKMKGLGMAATARIAAALELGRRAAIGTISENRPLLDTISKVADYFRCHYGANAPEKFVALFVNRQRRLLGELEVARGSSNAVVVDPRLIFKQALLLEAKGVIVAHNHPDNLLKPSNQDIELTRELTEAGQLCRIPLLGHALVTDFKEIAVQPR